jgi:hypothetical protein
MLSAVQALALRTPYEVVNERTNEMDEDDDEQPYQLIVTACRFICGAVDNGPDPENGCQ